MFNKETYDKIQNIPKIKGISTEVLPQFLTRVYAKVITSRITLSDDVSEDYEKLSLLANTLELIVLTGDGKEQIIKNAAFVGATARQLLHMIKGVDERPNMSLYSIPPAVSASLMFAISGHLADAQEMAKEINDELTDNPVVRDLLWGIKALLTGHLDELSSRIPVSRVDDQDIDKVAENIIFFKFFEVIQNAANFYLGNVEHLDGLETLKTIQSSAVYDLPEFGQKEVFTGVLILSGLLLDTIKVLENHCCINVPSPVLEDNGAWKSFMRSMAVRKPFLWSNHLEAIQRGYLGNGVSSIVTFPTGAGKSTIINLKIISSLIFKKRILYIVPTHALEHQVAKDMKNLTSSVTSFSNMDGEISHLQSAEDEESKIVIMTPERCLTKILLDSEQLLENVGLIVFDEFHLISGTVEDRRAPEAMATLVELLHRIPDADFLLSSAMVKNGEEIGKWISSATEHNCILLDSKWKPTCQLQGCVTYSLRELKELRRKVKSLKNNDVKLGSKKMKENLLITPYCFYSLKAIWDSKKPSDYYFSQLLEHKIHLTLNQRYDLTPNCNKVAAEIASKFSISKKKVIIFALQPGYTKSICKDLVDIYGRKGRAIPEVNWDQFADQKKAIEEELGSWNYSYLSECTVATQHHSLLLDYERTLAEDLFVKSKDINIIVATPTISQGINLPSDIVIIAGSMRYNPELQGREQIKAHDLLNAVGRAGRAGFHSHGAAILVPSSVIGLENNKVDAEWMRIREEIFSQGDRCLEIEDPLSFLFYRDDYYYSSPIIFKIQGDESELDKKFRKTFFFYQHMNERINIQRIVNDVISVRKDNSRDLDWCSELALKLGLKESDILLISESLPDDVTNNLETLSVADLIQIVEDLFAQIPEVLRSLLTSNLSEDELYKFLNIKNNEEEGKVVGELVCKIMREYVEGKPIIELETIIFKEKISPNLEKGRKLALRLIPALSYVCGIVTQILIDKCQRRGYNNFSEETLCFASCVKEGVTTKAMLLAKINNRWMRVETHRKFNNLS